MFPSGNTFDSNEIPTRRFRRETPRFRSETAAGKSMKEASVDNDKLSLDERLRQKIGRPSRVQSVAIRFTEEEAATIANAAKEKGTTLREWSREVLLRAARNSVTDPLFTEIVGLRMLLVHLFEPLLTGIQLTPDSVNKIMKTVREDKHNIAVEVMQQYTAKNVQEQ